MGGKQLWSPLLLIFFPSLVGCLDAVVSSRMRPLLHAQWPPLPLQPWEWEPRPAVINHWPESPSTSCSFGFPTPVSPNPCLTPPLSETPGMISVSLTQSSSSLQTRKPNAVKPREVRDVPQSHMAGQPGLH